MWVLLGTAIVFKSTNPWLYNVAHFLFGVASIAYFIMMGIIFLESKITYDVFRDKIIERSNVEDARKLKRITPLRMTISVIISLTLLIIIVGQGWFVISTFQLLGMIFFWMCVSDINQLFSDVKKHFGV
jgi:heme A synthase